MLTEESVRSYGIIETRTLSDEMDAHVEELEYNGFTVLDSGFSPAEIERVRDSIDKAYERQAAETASAAVVMPSDQDILRCPLAYDDIFLKVATAPALMELCRRVLGVNFVLLQQNAIINRPASREFQSQWHRDLLYQHFVTTKQLALNALFCVDDFTAETGGTVVLPGTHKAEKFPSPRFALKYEATASAKAGSILVLDAMLFHRSGHNASPRNRRGVNHVIGRPLLVQQLDLPRVLGDDYTDDDFLQRYLGYRWNPAPDVTSWRTKRAKATT